MKATLEFTLPQEREEHRLATVAVQLAAEVLAINERLRNWQKHAHAFRNADEAIDAFRKTIADAVALARGE